MDAPPRPLRARRGSGGITLADVARLAGVSAITVSRALNTPAAVAPETLERVRAAVARSGYVPNLMAGALASNRSRLVAALVPAIGGSVFLDTIQALTEALDEAGCQLMLGQTGYGGAREDALLDAIVGRRPDGIVLTGLLRSPQARRRLLASGIPVVETWDLTPTPLDMLVGFSHEDAGAAVAEHLHARGHRRLAIVGASDQRAQRRRAGFTRRLQALGAAAPLCWQMDAPPTALGHGRQALAALLAQGPAPQAVFCSSDALAHGVVTEAQARGLRVPDDLAVMGFGDMGFAADIHPALSSVRIDGTAIGRQAARFILDRAAGRDVGERVRDIGFSLVLRDSA